MKHSDRPAVGGHVVERHEQNMHLRSELEQSRPHHPVPGKIERPIGLATDAPLDFGLGRAGQILHRQGNGEVFLDRRDQFPARLRKSRAQGLVPQEDEVERPPEGLAIEPARDLKGLGDVEQRRAGLDLFEEPDGLLAE